jgi:hypothetical protein
MPESPRRDGGGETTMQNRLLFSASYRRAALPGAVKAVFFFKT